MGIIKNRILRWCVRNGFPNSLRIWCLKNIGVNVGKDVYIGEGFTIVSKLGRENNLYIGERVSIAPNVIIILGSNPNNSNLRNLKERYGFLDVKGKVTIEDDAWIGAGAIILPNIKIGKMSVVGAGSVVTKDVPPYSVVAGVPAKQIKVIRDGDI